MYMVGILLIISYIIVLACPVVYFIFHDYKKTFRTQVEANLRKTLLNQADKNKVTDLYIRKNHLFLKNLSNISLVFGILLGVSIAIYIGYIPKNPFGTALISTLVIMVTLMLATLSYCLADEFLYNKSISINCTTEEILSFYFNKKYPENSAILIPIYNHIIIDKNRTKFEANPIKPYTYYRANQNLTRFGDSLLLFTKAFDKAMQEDASTKVFNSEILTAENIDTLSKFMVILDEPDLLKQVISEDGNEYAIAFNDVFEKMVNDLMEKVDSIQKVGLTITEANILMNKKTSEEKSRERLALLVKQNFNIIK